MKYIKSFQTTEELEAYIASAESGDYLLRDESKERTEAIRNYYKEPTPVGYDFLTFTAQEANSTITGNLNNSSSIEYSLDGGNTWIDAEDVAITLENIGDSVKYRGEAEFKDTWESSFSMTGKIEVSGSIMSMLHKNPDATVIDVDNAFSYFFSENDALVSAENLVLSATALTEGCYESLFSDCTSLTTAPELPATTLKQDCYYNMFSGCSSLTTAPELPATTLANSCYFSMFYGCSSLTSAPELPATTLKQDCYNQMFSGCSSLTTAPELPATTLANQCYDSMFFYCTSLTSAPELPATTLAEGCYRNMFYGCNSLTSAPELPASTLVERCYEFMFNGCSSLNDVTVHATSWDTTHTYNWLNNVASTGTIHNLGGATNIPTNSASGCPTGWTLSNN